MGLGSAYKDHKGFYGDLVGGFTGKTGSDAAEDAAEISERELLRQFNITQGNLRPALDAAHAQLPGVTSQATTYNPFQMKPAVDGFLNNIEDFRGDAAADYMQSVGLDRPRVPGAVAGIDPAQELDLLLSAESDLFENRLELSGLGEGAGSVLSDLGQRTGANIASNDMQAALAAQQAQAQGQSNALGLVGTVASFFSDERMKTNIQEVGELDDGTKIYSWDWKPEFAEQMAGHSTIGPLAQDVADKHPEHVTMDASGYMKVLPSLGDEVANG
ncbi:tail fiber domain-containing protein [uncultured Paraglaciecola sp.]|uniref:tail fiber domain-containing protein n=1 Tax=uncultured Paraglaciecola sp. TaxID=1765024 RepID=UPI002626B125|nr:tail fiber domain-containing protein [uncultured Paraglaciecola sp.]